MLNLLRQSTAKKILWGLAIIIILAFLFGSLAYVSKRVEQPVCEIGGRKILRVEFDRYIKMAELNYRLTSAETDDNNYTYDDIIKKSWEFLLLIWKADKEKIKVNDADVIKTIQNRFSIKGKFEKEYYDRALAYHFKVAPHVFEEYIRNFLRISKLYEKFLKVNIPENELKDIFAKENKKAKISYVEVSYEKTEAGIIVGEKEAENFYNDNKKLFRQEPKVDFKYVLLPADIPSKERILRAAAKAKDLQILNEKFGQEIKSAGFVGLNEPIPGLGWQPMINQAAFSIKIGMVSEPLEINSGIVLLQKTAVQKSTIPEFAKIKDQVIAYVKRQKAKDTAKTIAAKIIKSAIEKKEKLEDLVKKENQELKTSDYFKFYDPIGEIGLYEELNKIAFSLEKGKIYQEPVILDMGAYVIRLDEVSDFDEKEYASKKEFYRQQLSSQRMFIEELKFRIELEKESGFKIIQPKQEPGQENQATQYPEP